MENHRVNQHQTHEYDVLVVGAGGAGLRAAIEASAGDVSVGLVCKSLLGKAHTVMAEGGIAAALATVDERDNCRVHFADTRRGGRHGGRGRGGVGGARWQGVGGQGCDREGRGRSRRRAGDGGRE